MIRPLRSRVAPVALAMVVLLAASTTLVNPSSVVAASTSAAEPAGLSWVELAADMTAPFRPLIDAVSGTQSVSTGSDGRLTFLLLGSDGRGTGASRTDSIMVVSVKGSSISVASIPRDTAHIPNPAGGTFKGKVNGIVRQYLFAGNSLSQSLAKFEIVIEKLLQIEIDYYALVWFGGFTTLVGKIDPVIVSQSEVRDGKQIDDHDKSVPKGVYFPASSAYSLYDYNPTGRPLCNGLWRTDTSGPIDSQYWCHRALPYVRSRKGPNNNDWIREARQQGFLASAIKAVSSSELSGLVATGAAQGNGKWVTDMPITYSNALDLYNRLHSASVTHSVVFKPNGYASRIKGTSGYELKLPVVRSWAASYLK